MNPEKESLLQDLLDGDTHSHRDRALLAGRRALRTKRRWRIARRYVAASALLFALSVLLPVWKPSTQTDPKKQSAAVSTLPASNKPATPTIHYLSDSELLNLFPGTPVALATIDGKKRLIFPRLGDEARFVAEIPN
jgi:hypothetical protein